MLFVTTLFLAIIFSSVVISSSSEAASPAQFSSTNSAIASAFVAAQSAEEKGGNVSGLVVILNEALGLVQNAESENATNPTQASTDLQNATTLAEMVSSEAVQIGQSGAAARMTRVMESIGASAVIVVVAVLIYIFGDRIYRRIWFYIYRDFIVKPA